MIFGDFVNCKTIFLVAMLVSFKGITMEKTYFKWAEFSKNYNDEINSADSVNALLSEYCRS